MHNLNSKNLPNLRNNIRSKSFYCTKSKESRRSVKLVYFNGNVCKTEENPFNDKSVQTTEKNSKSIKRSSICNQKERCRSAKELKLERGFSICMISNEKEAVTANFATIVDACCQKTTSESGDDDTVPIYKFLCIPASNVSKLPANSPLKLDVACQYEEMLKSEECKDIKMRKLNETYNKRIGELNSLPFRSDSLKMRRRKSSIEADLRKIDVQLKML
ncbi:unnamed protein product [Psylliodes chrysocephalus]|uniref:Enkurin domain-containing protein n=1 Tax=Psylliodes chrysocephalus TaxID=3402493 RepID=A0A9P0GFA5_9CUCU|nr:unnamed protein product [Psylliodes chrysocephala]